MTFPLKIIGLIKSKVVGSTNILITMDMSTPSTAGIKLRFASGSLTCDWGDGGGDIPFVTNVELTKTYTVPGIKVAEIKGDFANITRFRADNSKITAITNFQTGHLTELILNNNSLTSLNLSNATVSGTFWLYSNSPLSSLIFATSGNGIISNVLLNGCNFSSLDFSNVGVQGAIQAAGMGMTSVTFASSGNGALTGTCYFDGNSLPGLDLSNFPSSTGITIRLANNSFTAGEHDNQLINNIPSSWVNSSLSIITGNTARTSASDAAYNNLIANGWAIT